MSTDDLKHLLPYYVAGTLEPDERRRVDEALSVSDELRSDLQFWQDSQAAISVFAQHAAAGHVTAREIVDFAVGIIPNDRRERVERHLQSCSQCYEEFHLVRASLLTGGSTPPVRTGRLLSFVRSFRLVYALPVLVIATVTLLVLTRSDRGLQQSASRPAALPGGVDDRTSLRLTYQPEYRSASPESIATLRLGPQPSLVDVFIAIPRNTLSGIRYRATVGAEEVVSDSVRTFASGATHDSLHIVLLRSMIPPPGDTLRIRVREILPAGVKDLMPDEYYFSVLIEPRSSR